jgi:hypothetical protein
MGLFERTHREMKVFELVGTHVSQFSEQRDLAIPIGFRVGLELVQGRRYLEIARGAIDLARRVDRRHEGTVELEGFTIVEESTVRLSEPVLKQIPELVMHACDDLRVRAGSCEGPGSAFEHVDEPVGITRCLEQLLEP